MENEIGLPILNLDAPKQIKRYFRLAAGCALASDWKKVQIGAVIVQKNKVLTVGWNGAKENPLQKKFNINRGFDPNEVKNSVHAEINAISKLLKLYNKSDLDFSKISIFVYREHKDGTLAMARPCPACMAAIRSLKIKRVFYTGENSIISEILV